MDSIRENLLNDLINSFNELIETNGIDYRTDWIVLDNLDRCFLYFDNDHNKIMAENEHGTRFGLTELSGLEIEIILYILNKEVKNGFND